MFCLHYAKSNNIFCEGFNSNMVQRELYKFDTALDLLLLGANRTIITKEMLEYNVKQ